MELLVLCVFLVHWSWFYPRL